jgi:hypothetical protein
MYAHELYEQNKPKIVVTYPGRFQPFHQGHAGVFAKLQKQFGRDSVYILTSNDTSSAKSPFNFSDKYQLMTAAGVPGDKIIETNQMYKLPDSIDAANTIFITAVGAPDADRLNPDTYTKRDQKDKEGNVTKPAGSPSYYKTWGGPETPVTADQHGYVIVIPEIHKEVTIKGQKYDVSHGTECRNLWNSIRNDAKARTEFLSQMYARPSQELAAIFDKIPQTTAEDVGADSQTSTSPIHGKEFKQGVAETFNRPYRTKSEKSQSGDVDMLAKLPDGTYLSIMFSRADLVDDVWGVEFYRNNSQEVTGEGDAQRIFATVLNAIQKFIKKNKPQKLFFSASKEPDPSMYYGPDDVVPNPESRAKLYDRLVQRYAKAWGYRALRADTGTLVRYELTRIKQGVTEAFGPLPRDSQQIRLGRHTVDIERVGKDKNYIGFAWHDSKGQDHYEEVSVGDLGSYDDLIDRIKQEISYQERQYTDQGVAEDAAGVGVVAKNKKMARDPRYSMSITKDVKPSTPKNMLRALRLSEDSAVNEEQIMSMVKNFLPLAMKELKLKKLPKIILKKHIKSDDGQATFGRFVNEEEKIYLGIADRHPVDILRTLAHELVHFKQYEQGRMKPDSGDTGSPIENEAHAVAGVLMRYFNKKYPDAVKSSAVSLDESLFKRYQQFKENGDEADEVKKQKNLIPYPKGTVKVDVSDVYDWYKLGQEISDLDDANPADFGKGPPQTVMAFGSEPEEHRYLKDLKRLGLKTHDIDENFANGRNPQDKGDSKRYNVPTKGKISTLRKIAKQGGRRGQLAHWMANMRSGKNKK